MPSALATRFDFDTVRRIFPQRLYAEVDCADAMLWLGLLGFVAGAVWAYAQTQGPTFSLWDIESPSAATRQKPSLTRRRRVKMVLRRRQRLRQEVGLTALRPEIWRLPPVAATQRTFHPHWPCRRSRLPGAVVISARGQCPGLVVRRFVRRRAAEVRSFSPVRQTLGRQLRPGDGRSEGNSETFNLHFGFHAKRKAESNVLTLSLDYNRQTAPDDRHDQPLYFDGRLERMIDQSRWSLFAHETVEYDEFQSFNVRDTSDAGVGYRLIKNENTTLIGRFGAGFSHEYGGPENGQYIPEIVFGLQLEQQISKRQKILGLVEYAPDVGDFLRYRLRTQAAWKCSWTRRRISACAWAYWIGIRVSPTGHGPTTWITP